MGRAGRGSGSSTGQPVAVRNRFVCLGLVLAGRSWGSHSHHPSVMPPGPTVTTPPRSVAGTRQGQLRGAVPGCPRQSQQPWLGTWSIPCRGLCPWHRRHPAGLTIPAHSLPEARFPQEHFSQSPGGAGNWDSFHIKNDCISSMRN